MDIGYARVSTKDQSLDLQVDALRRAGCGKVYQEVVSGAKAERPVLDALLADLRPGDVLVIWKLDRLGRSLRHLVELASALLEKGVGLKSLNDPIDTTTSSGRLTFNLFASLSEFERDLIRERTRRLSVREIADQLGIAKSTLYQYLRHRGVPIGTPHLAKPGR